MIRCGARILMLGGLAALAAACTEDPITAVDADSAPGYSTPTIEVFLDVADLPAWRDTTYWGFATPSSASFSLLADQEDLSARALGRFSTIPDSLFVDTARVAIDSFTSAALRLTVDTLASDFPVDRMEVAVWALSRGFDDRQATWQLAAEGDPWSTPGGDLGTLLGVDSVSFAVDSLGSRPDTVRIELVGSADSLLTAWRDSDGEPGIAIVTSGSPVRIRTRSIAIVATAVPEGIDSVLTVVRGMAPGTFIFDPPTPSPTTRLRLTGMPSARYYMDFRLPDSLGLIPLRGSTINRATLEFRPTAGPPPPFRLEADMFAQAVRLLADPFEYGEKTPIGSGIGSQELLRPDSLAAGNTMEYDITALIRFWSQAPVDSVPNLSVGIIPVPENQQFGYWEFYSREDAAGLRPVVHLLFTPNPSFLFP